MRPSLSPFQKKIVTMIEALLYSGNVWLIIGLILAIAELTNGTLIFFLPTGLSGLLTGLLLRLQENQTLPVLLENWAITLTFWGFVSLALSLLLNYVVKQRETSEDINKYPNDLYK